MMTPERQDDKVEYTGTIPLESAQQLAAAHLVVADREGCHVERREFLTALAAGLYPQIFGRKAGKGAT